MRENDLSGGDSVGSGNAVWWGDAMNRVSTIWFSDSVMGGMALPEKFTFPFYYEPHPLTRVAVAELQHYLETQTELDHNFGCAADSAEGAAGKMFGVLVVRDGDGRVGYLSAFSGKLAGSNDHPRFVPPVFDMLAEDGFFVKGIRIIDGVSEQVSGIEVDESYLGLKLDMERIAVQSLREISALKGELKEAKASRKRIREEQKGRLNEIEYTLLEADLVRQSAHDGRRLKGLTEKWKQLSVETEVGLASFESSIEALKAERKERSAALQEQLFEQYVFLNRDGKGKSLHDIFKDTASGRPPTAAGECATPKLLQAAFLAGYKPLAMAEFWWGASSGSEIRKHGHFYPACTSKCKPILGHMLEGMEVDDDPFLVGSLVTVLGGDD